MEQIRSQFRVHPWMNQMDSKCVVTKNVDGNLVVLENVFQEQNVHFTNAGQ